ALDALGDLADPRVVHVRGRRDDALLLVHAGLLDRADDVLRPHLLERAGRLLVAADRQLRVRAIVAQRRRDDRRRDAPRRDRLPGLVHLAQEPRDERVDLRARARGGEVAEVLRRAEAAGEDDGVEVGGLDLGQVLDLAARDAGGFV